MKRDIMPSMRLLMTAGKAAEKENIAAYNCAFIPIDSLKAFDETMYILMCGTGVGFSVESEDVKKIPAIPDEFHDTDTTVVFEDSRLGWAKGYREFLSLLAAGLLPKWDTSKLRAAGARLKTMGGRSSGPAPLIELLEFTMQLFQKAAGRQLTSRECHDLECKVADIVVVGGVRRSALISLSDLNDIEMRDAKTGNWWQTHPYRRLANNSAVYEDKPSIGIFMEEWLSLYKSKSGERGIISRKAMKNIIQNANDFREKFFNGVARLREIIGWRFGCNPCVEIILRPDELCNLTSVQIYEDDTPETIREKVLLATILGTFQSTLTNFRYVNKKWQKNCNDERLLGVSLNGIYGNKYTNGIDLTRVFPNDFDFDLPKFLESLKSLAIETNMDYASDIGIPSSVAITCVKPEGTTSAYVGVPSGIHGDHAPFTIRHVRNDWKDPLTQFLIDKGVPWETDAYDPKNVACFKFPLKASKDAVFKKDITAIEHLELWKTYQMHYCEHKPSITVSVRESEWMEVGAWVYENFDIASGLSFLPAEENGTIYKQAPFTECTEEEYEALLTQMPKDIDWSELTKYELEDTTTNAQELSCFAGGCTI